jgi:catechol 2,3-dioxygenase-like lactoylglutathione lyase family enzyme
VIGGVCLGSNDLARSAAFYDAVLSTVGMVCGQRGEAEIGYHSPARGGPWLWILTPFDRRAAVPGNGVQVGFRAADRAGVHAFHDTALAHGGKDEGAPGPRSYSPGYYGAYCRDPDGNKLHVSCIVE